MKSYELKATHDKDLFRVVDRNGDWKFYFHKPTKQYLPAVNYVLDTGFAKGYGFYKWALSKSPDEAEKILQAAGDKGDAIHQFIAKIFTGEAKDRSCRILAEDNQTERTLTNDEWDAILGFQEFWNAHEPVLIVSEMSVYNLKAGYAGTLDAVLKLTKQCDNKLCKCKSFIGKVGVWDWKSGGGIYPSYGAQNAAYGASDNLKRFLGKRKVEYTAIARIGTNHKKGYELKFYDRKESNANYKKFLSAMDIADIKPFDPAKEVYEIPDVLNIQIKKEQSKTLKTKLKVGVNILN